ncbi:hypothetical protein L2734_09455 [Parashewanella spongiae]|nr:hypothetical protein [Parashewanella spongiae]MCL1078392.1 hypothetical protein [Parashewanella spongiae]
MFSDVLQLSSAQWGIKPNVAIYNAFITVCAKTGSLIVLGNWCVVASP